MFCLRSLIVVSSLLQSAKTPLSQSHSSQTQTLLSASVPPVLEVLVWVELPPDPPEAPPVPEPPVPAFLPVPPESESDPRVPEAMESLPAEPPEPVVSAPAEPPELLDVAEVSEPSAPAEPPVSPELQVWWSWQLSKDSPQPGISTKTTAATAIRCPRKGVGIREYKCIVHPMCSCRRVVLFVATAWLIG